jgi:putative DNA primase/helicase
MDSDTSASSLGEIPDIGPLSHIFDQLLAAKADASIEGFRRAVKSLSPDYPILEELLKPSRYQPLSITDLLNMSEQKWILTNFLYEDAISCLYGLPSSAKSFIALDWACCLALGRYWKGRKVQQCRILYLAAEGVRGYRRRVQAWCHHFGVPLSELERYLAFIPCEVPLGNPAEVLDFIEVIQDYLDSQRNDLPVVLVLDTIFQCTAGENINLTEVMGKVFASVKLIKAEIKATHVLLVHHSGKDTSRGMSGNISLKANADMTYYAESDKEGNITLTADKMKDDEETTTYLVRQKVIYGEGERDNSCVILVREKPVQQVLLTITQRAMIDVLPETGEGIRNSEWMKRCTIPRQTFLDNIKKLIDKGQVIKSGTDEMPLYLRKKVEVENEVDE